MITIDYRLLFADPAIRQEFVDRSDELCGEVSYLAAGSRLEGLEGGSLRRRAAEAVDCMLDGRWSGQDPALEAIVRRFARPVYLIQHTTAVVPPNDFPISQIISDQLASTAKRLATAIPTAGRIDLRNHRYTWVGTAWLVADDVIVTNSHVAREFACPKYRGFAFAAGPGGTVVRASFDRRREYRQPAESRFRVEEILWIEPQDSVDVALLRISSTDELGEPAPPPVPLMTATELAQAGQASWIAVIGYPAYDSRYNSHDQQRLFDGIYDVKRLAPGMVTGLVSDEILHHDATTLGGNSGSLVVDLASGRAAALHFGGFAGERNLAVQAPVIAALLERHASGVTSGRP